MNAPLWPYRPAAEDLAASGDLPIWEIPVTILAQPRWWNLSINTYQRLRSRPIQDHPVWLRPSTTSWPWLRWIVGSRLRQARSLDFTVFNIMFHSMEVIAGASPYSPTPRAAQRVLGRLNRLLGLFESLGARFLTLSELAEELERRERATRWAA
jgi:hypothetical protein